MKTPEEMKAELGKMLLRERNSRWTNVLIFECDLYELGDYTFLRTVFEFKHPSVPTQFSFYIPACHLDKAKDVKETLTALLEAELACL